MANRRHITAASLVVTFIVWSTEAQNDVRIPPTIIRQPSTKDKFYVLDHRIELECEATGTGYISYHWTKNKVPLDLNDGRLNVEFGGRKVTIRRSSRLDAGYYQCFASSLYGTAMSNTVFVQRAAVDEFASEEIDWLIVTEGKPFRIRALDRMSYPRPRYYWETATSTEDPAPEKLPLSNRIQVDEDGNLYFAYAEQSDSLGGSIYKLITNNEYLDKKYGGSYTRVTVIPSENDVRDFAPQANASFPSSDTTIEALVGRSISLRCFFSAKPVAEYTWTLPKNANRLPHDLYKDPTRTELIITDIKHSDEGEYTCTASNGISPKAYRKHYVQVEEAATFRKPGDQPMNKNVTEGDTAIFRCKGVGKPTPITVWYRNGEVLDSTNLPRRMRFMDNGATLLIENVCRECEYGPYERDTDLMVIQCNSSNVHGYALGTGYLNVLRKTVVTLHTADTINLKFSDYGTFIFRCSVVSDPSTPVSIVWRKMAHYDPSSDFSVTQDNKNIFISEGDLKIVIDQNSSEKWKDLAGVYKCTANNGYSSDFKQVTLNVEGVAEARGRASPRPRPPKPKSKQRLPKPGSKPKSKPSVSKPKKKPKHQVSKPAQKPSVSKPKSKPTVSKSKPKTKSRPKSILN